MTVKFEYKEFNEFQEKLLKIAKEKFPRETKNFMGRAGNKLRSNVKKAYIKRVRKKTGNLLKVNISWVKFIGILNRNLRK